jgi:hypothetical protein
MYADSRVQATRAAPRNPLQNMMLGRIALARHWAAINPLLFV